MVVSVDEGEWMAWNEGERRGVSGRKEDGDGTSRFGKAVDGEMVFVKWLMVNKERK